MYFAAGIGVGAAELFLQNANWQGSSGIFGSKCAPNGVVRIFTASGGIERLYPYSKQEQLIWGKIMIKWKRQLCATLLGVSFIGAHNVGAQPDIPVAVTFPDAIDDLFTAVSFNPRVRVGGFYVSGSDGIATGQSPSMRVATTARVRKLAAVGGASQRSGVFALTGLPSEIYVHDPGIAGVTLLGNGNAVMTDMLMNRRDGQLLTLDEAPTLLPAAQRIGAQVLAWSTETRDTITGFKIRKSINSVDEPRCPCKIAADPNQFRQIYAIADGDTVTAHRFNLGRNSSATGQIVVASPTGTFQSLSQIIADVDRAYVTDSQGRLHTVTPLGDEPAFRNETLQLSTALTGITISGTLIKDTELFSPYFYEAVSNPNTPQDSPSVIKVYKSGPVLVATIVTATRLLGPFTFTPSEIFFWDGAALKAMRRGTWQVRTIPNTPADGAGVPVHYDAFDNVIRIPVAARGVVSIVDAGTPAPIVRLAQNDLSGDAKSDLIFRNASTGQINAWLMNGTAPIAQAGLVEPGNWTVSHAADFNGDGKSDIVFRNDNGSVTLWLMDGLTVLGGVGLLGADPDWRVSHVGDFNGDGSADILWRNNNGAVTLWLMNGTTVVSAVGLLGADANWRVSQVADFNGDGNTDLLWRHTNGAVTMWIMNGSTVASATGLLEPNPDWRVSHIADLNGDGNADLVWRNENGAVTAWLMNGASVNSAAGLLGADANWRVTHMGDFNGDDKTDILWRHTNGAVTQWLMNGTNVTSAVGLLGPDPNWRVTHLGDYNGDQKADLVWRNTNDGSITMWLMDGATVTGAAGILGASPWGVVPPTP
jgi:hypothetical protein